MDETQKEDVPRTGQTVAVLALTILAIGSGLVLAYSALISGDQVSLTTISHVMTTCVGALIGVISGNFNTPKEKQCKCEE